jgi:hypothetical protein
MNIRRIITGNDANGKSIFLSDGVVPHSHDFESMPGQAQTRVWFAAGTPTTTPPADEPTSETGPVIPRPGGASFVIVHYAPDSVATGAGFDPERANAEFATYAPDITAAMDPDDPGMHRTASVDYGVILDGEVWLELDDGAQTRLTRGDTVVQLGARHAWRNKTDRPATVVFVLTGASE